jgi:hypothetical protein
MVPAPAQDLPTLSKFLANCSRDSTICRAKVRDYIVAADTQKSICRPQDQSQGEAVSDLLAWLRDSEKHQTKLEDQPYDEAFWAGSSTLWPCAPAPEPPPPPAPEPPSGQ